MSEKRTIYAVSSGSYSDYSVIALFEREEDANAYALDIGTEGYGGAFVEEFDYWPAGARPKVVRVYRSYWNPQNQWKASDSLTATPELLARLKRPAVRELSHPHNPISWGGAWIMGEALDEQDLRKAMSDAIALVRTREGI